MKNYLSYIEFGGDMECCDCLYFDYQIVKGADEKDALKELQRKYHVDISGGSFYGRKINLIELPSKATGSWKDLKVIEVDKPKEKLICDVCKREVKSVYVREINNNGNISHMYICKDCK